MERFELAQELKDEIRARVMGEGFMKIVQTVRRNGKLFKISMRPVENGGVLVFSVLYATWLFKEKITPFKAVGLLLALAALVLLGAATA